MKICLIKVLLWAFLCISLGVMGQDSRLLAGKPENVFKALRPADRQALIERYTAVMNSPLLSREAKELIDSIFLDLQDLHVTVVPELQNYILSVSSFCERQETDNLNIWLGGLQKALTAAERRRMLVKSWLESTFALACRQQLFCGSGHLWQVQGKLNWHAEPKIGVDFQEVDLCCMTRRDTIRILRTRGTYTLGEDALTAYGGIVKWYETEEKMSAELNHYRINLKVAGYTADSVCFHYEDKYGRVLWGSLKDNALKTVRGKEVPFPEFTSYNTDVEIRNMYKGIHFLGGITYRGTKFSGTGTEKHPAFLHIVPNDSIALKLYSRQFVFDSTWITSGHTVLEIELDSGSIVHPDIHFMYSIPQHTVMLKRLSEQSLHIPFKDSYHCILYDVDEIYWPLDGEELEMRMSSRTGLTKATVESMNFFTDRVYDDLQGIDEINPLNGLLKCSLALDSDVFSISDYAEFIKKPADQLRKQVILLSYKDFVDYNEVDDEVVLKQRLYDYTKARVKKQDYDNIRFVSRPGEGRVSARMNVRNYNLRIMGIDQFTISEAHHIFVEPFDHQLFLMKNRDMSFNGKLSAGMFDMYGQNLFFSYERYSIVLPRVDSTRMYVVGIDNEVRGRKVESLIRDISGELIIDKPDNKSGKKENPKFPLLNSKKESFVYFDHPDIREGRYKRDSFYYRIDPYTIEAINDASRFRCAFKGTLVSNIVSPINDTLRLLEDNVLGMNYQTPVNGLELYGKGHIHSRITLDRRGFLASGTVNMNGSEFDSDTILLLPQQLMANATEIRIDSVKNQRTGAFGKEVKVQYTPETGSLLASSGAIPFDLYHGRVKHTGTLKVNDRSLDANGKLQLKGAEMQSGLIHLQENRIMAERSAVNVLSVANKEVRLNTSDVKVDIDLLADKGVFVNNTDNNKIEFTSSRYSCLFAGFTWYMKEGALNIGVEDPLLLAEMEKTEDIVSLPKAGRNLFVSTNRQLDSLNFVAPLARYDLESGDIDCHGVNHVDIANGRFYPESGHLYIESDGDIREFTGGKLLCEREDSSRILNKVRLKLTGRNVFNGSGDYVYVSEEQKQSNIHFTELGADTAGLLYARVQLKEDESLHLNDGFRYKGEVTLHSREPELYFAGYVRLAADTSHLKHTWVGVKDYLTARHIRIPLRVENRNDEQLRVYNGIYLNTDNVYKPYAAFMSNRYFYHDDLLIGGEGGMEWVPGKGQYVISDTLHDRFYRFCYAPETGLVSAFGKITLDLKIPGLRQQVAGDIGYDLKKQELDIRDVLYLVDFTILNRMETVLLKDFTDSSPNRMKVSQGVVKKMYEIFGKSEMPGIEKQLNHPLSHVPDSLKSLFVLDSVNLIWNAQMHSYTADGEVNVLAIKGRPIGKRMNIKMELLRKHSGSQYFMYIYNDNIWYYFEFSDRNLYTLSSNQEYNEIIKAEKAEKKVVQTEGNEVLYTITLCPNSKRERFLKRIN